MAESNINLPTLSLTEGFYDHFVDGILILDTKGIVIYINQISCDVTEYSKEEILGKPFYKLPFLSKKTTLFVLKKFTDRLRGKKVTPYTIEATTKTGKQIHLRISGNVIKNRANITTYVFLIVQDVTDEKKQDERLKIVNEKLEMFQELANLGSWELDIKTGKMVWSDEFYRICGYKPGDIEASEENSLNIVHPEDREKFEKARKKALEESSEYKIKKRIIRPDGNVVYVQSIGKVELDEDGNPDVFIGTILDISETRKVSEDIKKERDKLNMLMNTMGEGVVVIDMNGIVEYINSFGLRLIDLDKNEVVGKRWAGETVRLFENSKEIAPRNYPCAKALMTRSGVELTLGDDIYYETKTGKKFPVVSISNPVIEEGQITGFVEVFRDISLEKEAMMITEQTIERKSQELREEKVRSTSVLENVLGSVVVTDTEGRVIYINPAFERLLGHSKEGVIGKIFADVGRGYSLEGILMDNTQMSDAAAITAEHKQTKLLIGNKSGEVTPVVMSASPVRVDNEYKGCVRVFNDYTRDYQLQRQRDDFFSIASHELRTPLTVISGNLDIILSDMRKSTLTKEEEQLLYDSELAADRLIKLVNDFLNVSRIDQHRVQVRLVDANICELVSQVVQELDLLVKNKGLRIETIFGSELKVRVDENLLREILVNLIGNSIKFTQRGGVRVTVSNKTPMASVLIIDTGDGIAKEKQHLLFNRFQQVSERTLDRDASGTGLGLYISREFARLMGGDVNLIQSDIGKGSIFEVTLPLSKRGY